MTDFTGSSALPVTVWTGGKYSLGIGTRGPAAGSAGFASVAWGTVNLAILTPIWIPFRYPIRNLFWYNFATVAGNVDCGIYSSELARLVSSGSVAQAGASTIQFSAVDLVLEPGQYYVALASSSATATFAASALGTATRERYFGLLQQTTALPLPASITPALVANARVPAVGFTHLTGTPSF